MDFDLEGSLSLQSSHETSTNADQIDIGRRLKMLRVDKGWNLSEAGQKIGIAHSTLSKIERNDLSPTLGTLQKIAVGLGVDIATMLSSGQPAGGAGRRSITRGKHETLHATDTCQNGWIASDLVKKKMLPFHTRVTAREASEYSEWQYHEGEMFVYVLSGTLVVYSEFYGPATLNTGDSIYYDATMGHKWTSGGETDAEVLWIYAH